MRRRPRLVASENVMRSWLNRPELRPAPVTHVRYANDSVKVSDSATTSVIVDVGAVVFLGGTSTGHSNSSARLTVVRQPNGKTQVTVPQQQSDLVRYGWRFGTSGWFMGLGALVGHGPGAVVGLLVGWAWAEYKLWDGPRRGS